MFYGRAGAWAGQDWNTNLGVPTGWYYWLPPNGGNDGLLNDGFENTVVTSEAAHSGMYSLKFDLPFTESHAGFVGTKACPSVWGEGVSRSGRRHAEDQRLDQGEQSGAGFSGDVSGHVVSGTHSAVVYG
jgi:hypothetical protein